MTAVNIILCVLGVLIALIIFILFQKIRIYALYREETAQIYAKLLFIKVPIYPSVRKKNKKAKKKKRTEIPDAEPENRKKPENSSVHTEIAGEKNVKKPEKPARKQTKEKNIKKLLKMTSRLITEFLPRFGKALTVHIERLAVTVGGDDAAEVAVTYGKICACVGGLLALEENSQKKFVIHEPIDVGIDYVSRSIVCDIEIRLDIGVFRALAALLRAGRIYISYKL